MIRIWNHKGGSYPFFYCDLCQERITDPQMAMALYRDSDEYKSDEVLEVWHVHKGACDQRMGERLGGQANTRWQELTDHLLYLCFNTKLPPAELVKIDKENEKIGYYCL